MFINGKEIFGEEAEKRGIFGVTAGPATAEEVDKLLSDLKEQESSSDAREALQSLRDLSPNDERRSAVLTALRGQISAGEKYNYNVAWQAYRNWMDASCAPELRRVIAKSETHRKHALGALAKLKQVEYVPLLLKHIALLDIMARQSLSKSGSKFDYQVLDALEAATDSESQSRLVDLLNDAASRDSLPRLKKLLSGLDDHLTRSKLQALVLRLQVTSF